jgi:hypothetical protein
VVIVGAFKTIKEEKMLSAGAVGAMAVDEYHDARKKFPAFHSAHEGYAVLKEEVDELWDLVKMGKGMNLKKCEQAKTEAIQIAAMAIAFYLEVCDE